LNIKPFFSGGADGSSYVMTLAKIRVRFIDNGSKPMARTFKLGEHVEWNSEAGRVRGVIVKKVVSDVRFKGYVHHASKEEPQ
jgi:hypothetical protein